MPIDEPYNVYQERLTSQFHGIALWSPNPVQSLYDYGRVSIGDVGYLRDGKFTRMFNVTLPWDDPSNGKLGTPDRYDPLERDFVVRRSEFDGAEYCSPQIISKVENDHNVQAQIPNKVECHTYGCRARSRGAFLLLPHGGLREDVIHAKNFGIYATDNVASWFDWAKRRGLLVDRFEDLILVTGCTLVTSWAAAAFDTTSADDASISLDAQKSDRGGTHFFWYNMRGNVVFQDSHFDRNSEGLLPQNQCVFIRGFRVKRVLFWNKLIRAAAEPPPDNPDNRRDVKIQVTRVTAIPMYRDPIIGGLDYIAEKCLEDAIAEDTTIATVHDDDHHLIKDAETPTADATDGFLREEQLPLLVENGGVCPVPLQGMREGRMLVSTVASLRDPRDNEPPVSNEKEAIFCAKAELKRDPVSLVVHPVLKRYLKLEMTESLDRRDYDITKELTSPDVYARIQLLKPKNCQAYPQIINIDAFSDIWGADVTIQDVTRMIYEDSRMSPSKRELNKLSGEERAAIGTAFKEIGKIEEERSKGPRRIDHLGDRDRHYKLSKLSPTVVYYALCLLLTLALRSIFVG